MSPKVGEIWVVRCEGDEDQWWLYEVLAIARGQCEDDESVQYVVCVKLNPDSLESLAHAMVFRLPDGLSDDILDQYRLTRKSRRQARKL